MKKIMLVFGTRPEAIKMCPLVRELRLSRTLDVKVCVSGQHRELLRNALEAFGVKPEYNLDIMKNGQSLFDITEAVLRGVGGVLERERPELVLVHGDTTTALAAALAAFYSGIPSGHIEAGLRTYNIHSPFPEELNRRAIALMSQLHFAPTERAAENLRREGVDKDRIFVTGNTVADALRLTLRADYSHPLLDWAGQGRLVILTAHRRESRGEAMERMLGAIRRVAEERQDIRVLYPIHPSPAVRAAAQKAFENCERIRLTEPLGVIDFHNLLARCYMVLTDSGGIQEEASALGKPLLVMRESTERGEGIESGGLRLVGCGEEKIYGSFCRLLDDGELYRRMAEAENPFGGGGAVKKITDIISKLP